MDSRFLSSPSRCGNPHNNARAESILKTQKVEWACVGDRETFEDVAADSPHFIGGTCNATRLHSALGFPGPNGSEEINAPNGSRNAG